MKKLFYNFLIFPLMVVEIILITGGTAMPSETLYVSNTESLLEALQSASGGETIYMDPGDYGALSIKGSSVTDLFKFDTPVTIKSSDPDSPAVVDRLDLNSVKNITFDGIKVEANPESTLREFFLIRINGSEGVTFKNGEVDGGLVDTTEGILSGFSVSNSNDVTLDNNSIHNLKRGSVVSSVDGIAVTNNNYENNAYDHADFGPDLNNVVVDGNVFGNIDVRFAAENHQDHIQFWTNGATENTTNVTISNNTILQTVGGTQSIFLTGDANGYLIDGLTIEGNTIFNAHAHGISVGGVTNTIITGNSVVGSGLMGDSSLYQPRININGSTGVTVSNNVTMGVAISGSSDTTENGNVVVQNLDPSGGDYIDAAFVNANAGASITIEDLMPLPDGILAGGDGKFVGALEFAPFEDFSVFALQSPSVTLGERGVVFEAMVANADGSNITDDTMTFRWEFADGTVKTGRIVEHQVALGGDQSVNLSVSDSAGNQDQTSKNFSLPNRDALVLDFEDGAVDASGKETSVTWTGEESIGTTDGGNKLGVFNGEPVSEGGSYIKLANDPEFFNTPNLTLALTFQAEPESIEAQQVLFGAHLRYGIQVKGGNQLIVYLDGWRTIDGINYADGQPHSVGLTFNNGEALVYFDGEVVANIQASFDTIPPAGYWGPTIGAATYSQNVFNGTIDNVRVMRETLNPEDMASLLANELDLSVSPPQPEPEPEPVADTPPATDPANGDGPSSPPPPPVFNEIEGTRAADLLQGTASDDRIIGGIGKDTIYGGDGDDLIEGGTNRDVLFGGNGDDTLVGGHGTDILTGGAGSDTFVFRDIAYSTADVITDYEAGVDRIDFSTMSYTGIVERGQDTKFGELEYYEENGGIIIRDPNGTFMLRLEGSTSLDVNDVMLSTTLPVFGDGNDIAGSTQNWVDQENWGSSVLDLGGGDDVITLKNYVGDFIFGNAGNDQISVGHGRDVVYGGEGDDIINGQGNADRLYGEAGNDRLDGGHTTDFLDGGTGDDILIGGDGGDIMIGGEGMDVFRYQNANESTVSIRDLVKDFVKGEDKIDVSALGITGISATESGATDSQLVVSQIDGQTVLSNEVLGFEILFDGIIDFTSEDLLI